MSDEGPSHGHDCSLHTCWREVTAFDWTRMHHGICPKCAEDKFIGHGPLCGDCYASAAGRDHE